MLDRTPHFQENWKTKHTLNTGVVCYHSNTDSRVFRRNCRLCRANPYPSTHPGRIHQSHRESSDCCLKSVNASCRLCIIIIILCVWVTLCVFVLSACNEYREKENRKSLAAYRSFGCVNACVIPSRITRIPSTIRIIGRPTINFHQAMKEV